MGHFRDEVIIKIFGQNVRKKRKEKGMTMEQFSAILDIEYKQLSRIEKGEVNTSISRAFSIAMALGIGIDELFHENR